MLIVYFVNYYILRQGDDTWLTETGWRWVFASEIIPAVFFVLLLFVSETPRYRVMKDKTEEAIVKTRSFLSLQTDAIHAQAVCNYHDWLFIALGQFNKYLTQY